jgi:hypothetical protein
MGIFDNPGSKGVKVNDSKRYGPGQQYYGGKGTPDGLGHGHKNPNNQFDRPPVANFLGNVAARNAGVELNNSRQTPRWGAPPKK